MSLQPQRHLAATRVPQRPQGIPQEDRNPVTALHMEHTPGRVANYISYVAETFQRQIEYVRLHHI